MAQWYHIGTTIKSSSVSTICYTLQWVYMVGGICASDSICPPIEFLTPVPTSSEKGQPFAHWGCLWRRVNTPSNFCDQLLGRRRANWPSSRPNFADHPQGHGSKRSCQQGQWKMPDQVAAPPFPFVVGGRSSAPSQDNSADHFVSVWSLNPFQQQPKSADI